MKVDLSYGQGHLSVEFPEDRTTVIQPSSVPGLPDEKGAMFDALNHPIGARPLKSQIQPSDTICIVFTDKTRATPNHRIIPWLLEYLGDHPVKNITLLNALGTHLPNSRAELEKLLTPAVVEKYRVLNHEPENPEALVAFGETKDGVPALINKHLVRADVRIITGFIEPHFFAGFSGGPKGIMPGVAGLQTVMSNHGEKNIGHPQSTFGITEGNPLWEELRDIALRIGNCFLLNVTLNDQRRITGVFAGDLIEAHRHGTGFVRQSAMQKVAQPFDIVVSTNSGYPLDLNLYQGVKGMSAGGRILKPGGTLILACECREGFPANSPMEKLFESVSSSEELLALLSTPGFVRPEQWQAQIQALLQRRADIHVYSALPDEVLKKAFLTPCKNIAQTIQSKLAVLGPSARVAVLPQGPLTIPYLD
ncbi:MAG: hypothetical protein JWN25_1489 [Verrucomicrobiales bacterium]|nr:hypothetical protein [Verrucomicrobiales bacterium]